VRCANDVVLDLQIIEQEFHWQIVVRLDATHFGSREDNNGRLLFREKPIDVGFVPQVELSAIAGDQIRESLFPQFADEGASDQASMTGDEYFIRLLHKRSDDLRPTIFFFEPMRNPQFAQTRLPF